MSTPFQRIGILGGGLLGGSIALALRDKVEIRLWFRKEPAVGPAIAMGFANATHSLADAVSAADLLILAVPVGAMPALLAEAVAAGLPPGCLVTDVGSVKQSVHDSLAAILAESGNPFIGSHPMAGSERNGIGSARADLFHGAACLMTNDSGAPPELCGRLAGFWESLGCRVSWFAAAEHDSIVARISHLPHITAAATALSALRGGTGYGSLSGGGLRDTTRVASGNPAMWAEILTENRDSIMPELKDTISRLQDILAALENGDKETAAEWLREAKDLRDTLK